ncbi:MAG: glycerol-3-phosphate acyltransferase, partial [Patescibacteria group bacterium]
MNNLGLYCAGLTSSYLLGSCLFGVWLARGNQGDPRHFGAQNNGLALLARRLGWVRSLCISSLDISKGIVVILLSRIFGPPGDSVFAPLCLVFLLLGHRYPLFRPPGFTALPVKTGKQAQKPTSRRADFIARVTEGRFVGGVGATSLLGAFLMIAPVVTTICLLLWVAAIYLWQYSAVANLVTIGSALLLLFVTGVDRVWVVVATFGGLLTLWSYWPALKLLAQGKETRLLVYPGFSLKTGMVATRVRGAYGDFFDYDLKNSRLTATGGATPWAFLVHPLDPEGFIDLDPKIAAALIRRAQTRQMMLDDSDPLILEALRKKGDQFDKNIRALGVRPIGEGVFAIRGRRTVGTFIFVPYIAERFAEAMVLRSEGYLDLYEEIMSSIVEAARQAHTLGARVLGLGAFTSIISAGGEELVRRLHEIGIDDLFVTSGNTYTAAALVQGAIAGCRKMGKDPATSTVIMYGLGSVGTPASYLLAHRFRRIILVARNQGKMARLAKDLMAAVDSGQHEITYTDDLRSVLL